MSNYTALKTAIDQAIYPNNRMEITAQRLAGILKTVVDSIGSGFIYKGVVTPQSDPGTPDQNVFYVGGPGVYDNLGDTKTVSEGYLGFFKYAGSWNMETVQVGDANAVKYIVQSLTNEQKEQARTNIGAGTYTKPGTGIPVSDLAEGVIPTISTDISADAESDAKTTSPKAVKTYVDAHSGDGAVKYTKQTLTDPQKQQARDNIDAASITELNQIESEVRGLSGRYYGIFESIENLPEGDAVGYAFVGTEAPFAIYQFDGTNWTDSGARAQAIYGPPGKDGVGLQTITSLMDGTVVLSLTNGDTVTIDLNHQHTQYLKYVYCESQAEYDAISPKYSDTLYLIRESN